MLTPVVFNMAFNYIKRFNQSNRLGFEGEGWMRRGESVMIVAVVSISEWTFAVVTVNYLRAGEVDNFSTDTTLMIFLHRFCCIIFNGDSLLQFEIIVISVRLHFIYHECNNVLHRRIVKNRSIPSNMFLWMRCSVSPFFMATELILGRPIAILCSMFPASSAILDYQQIDKKMNRQLKLYFQTISFIVQNVLRV
jgi:hypothetical protein